MRQLKVLSEESSYAFYNDKIGGGTNSTWRKSRKRTVPGKPHHALERNRRMPTGARNIAPRNVRNSL